MSLNVKTKLFLILLGIGMLIWTAVEMNAVVGTNPKYSSTGVALLLKQAAKLIFACCLLGAALVEHISAPLTGLIDKIFGLNPSCEKAPLDFAKIEEFTSKSLFGAAELEFERLLQYHPRSVDLWNRYLSHTAQWFCAEEVAVVRGRAREALWWMPWKLAAVRVPS
jgi:hypothetical protein